MINYLKTWLIIKKKVINEVLKAKINTSYIKFAILCAPRTGSTMLHTYLNSHPQILSHGEIIRRTQEQNRDFNLYKDVFKPYSNNLKAVGLKLFYEHENQAGFKECFSEIMDDSSIKIIHLIRKNILRQYVSLQIADQTQVWSTTKTPEYNPKIQVDMSDFKDYEKTHHITQNSLIERLNSHEVCTIHYEDLVNDPVETLKEVQYFLNVEPKKLFTLLKKQNPRPLNELVVNWEDFNH